MTDDRKRDAVFTHTFGDHGTLVLTVSCSFRLYWFEETTSWDDLQQPLRHYALLHIGFGRIDNITALEVAIPFAMLIVGWAADKAFPEAIEEPTAKDH